MELPSSALINEISGSPFSQVWHKKKKKGIVPWKLLLIPGLIVHAVWYLMVSDLWCLERLTDAQYQLSFDWIPICISIRGLSLASWLVIVLNGSLSNGLSLHGRLHKLTDLGVRKARGRTRKPPCFDTLTTEQRTLPSWLAYLQRNCFSHSTTRILASVTGKCCQFAGLTEIYKNPLVWSL